MSLVRVEAAAPRVMRLVLARPGMHNALVPELLDALLGALRDIAGNPECAAVVLAAEGPAFSIGGDMRRFRREREGDLHGYSSALVGKLNQAILALVDLPQPVVAAVQGIVTGGSIGLVLAADLAYLAPQALFKAHYVSAGFAPDGGWTALATRLAGPRRIASALLLNATIRADEAVSWGLANAVVPAAELQSAALAAAMRVAGYPAGTLRAAKSLLHRDRAALAADLEAERGKFLELVDAPAARDGVDDFLRRYPDYPDSPDC